MAVMELTLPELDAAIERAQLGQTLEQQAADWAATPYTFLRAAWPLLEPDTHFSDNWHIKSLCDHLHAVSDGELQRLIITIPPGTTKSITTSVVWPVWDWIHHPSRLFITGSYGEKLATDLAVKSRFLIGHSWFTSRWPHIAITKGEDLKTEYRNTRRGRRIAITPSGGGTGFHANIIIVDDPHDAREVATPSGLKPALEWQDGKLSQRFADPKTGAEVVIMQRLHENDLVGHLLGKKDHGWTVLCLPERYEPEHPYVTPAEIVLPSGRVLQGDIRTKAGELLCPDRIGERENKIRFEDLGSFRAAGQLQQRPTSEEGEILRRQDWMFYSPELLKPDQIHNLPAFTHVIQSWDTTFKDTAASDFVVGQVWGIKGGNRYLLRVERDRMNLTLCKTKMGELAAWIQERWPRAYQKVLVENTANGPDIIADMKQKIPGLEAITAKGKKEQRAIAASPALESGNVWVPGVKSNNPSGYEDNKTPGSTQQLIEEAAAFPNGGNDDSVDAFSQAMNWARGRAVRGSVSTAPQVGRIQVGNIPMGGWQP